MLIFASLQGEEKKKETERLSLLRLNHSPTSWQNSITSKKGMLSLHCPRHWRMFGCLRLLRRGRNTKKKKKVQIQSSTGKRLYCYGFIIDLNKYICLLVELFYKHSHLYNSPRKANTVCSSAVDFSALSYLYGSDSARNFLCSSGLALTRSSFTTAWEELQSHNTSARITWDRSTWRTLWRKTPGGHSGTMLSPG